MSIEPRIQEIGRQLISGKRRPTVNFQSWSQTLVNGMMEHEEFRVASLRFTDVAPTLQDDKQFMDHLTAYFKDGGLLKNFVGGGLPGKGLLGKAVAPLMRRSIKAMATTFIAGETLESSLKHFKKMHDNGFAIAVDLLGEAVISRSEADAFIASYMETIKAIGEATQRWELPTYPEHSRSTYIARGNVSIKLSALYEHINTAAHDVTKEALLTRVRPLLDQAMKYGVYLHFDQEQYEYHDLIEDVFSTIIMEEKYKDYPHVGIVCQAYLKDSSHYLNRLIALGKKRGTSFAIRLVKGAYWDYEQAHADQMNWPTPTFDHKEDTDANYEQLTIKLLRAYQVLRPCIASHNARSLAHALAVMEDLNLEKGDVEFQMLYGMSAAYEEKIKALGLRLRLYCPLGEFIPGMAYLVRRLLENTANQSFLRQYGKEQKDEEALLAKPKFTGKGLENHHAFLNRPLVDFARAENRKKAQKALEKFNSKPTPIVVQPVVAGMVVPTKDVHTHLCPSNKTRAITKVGLATIQDADKAIANAKTAHPAWRNLGAQHRADILHKAADLTEAAWPELFALQVYEAGKDWHSADGDIAEGIDFFRYYADKMPKLADHLQPESRWGELNSLVLEPRGIYTVIAPWNFPFAISAGMVAGALVAGNCVVYKPSGQTSAIGQKLCEILWAAGVPKDVLHFMPSSGSVVGSHLVEHADIAGIAFTGSRTVGCQIYEKAAKVVPGQRQLKNTIIEMGGKNALILDYDADWDEAIPALVYSAFGFQGQKCSACSRAIVVTDKFDLFLKRLKETVESLTTGPADDPKYDANCVIDEAAFKKINGYIKQGQKDGKLLAQGKKPEGDGWFIPPTVFYDLKKGSSLTEEEIFGPVLNVYHAKTLDEALAMAQDSDYALTGGIITRHPNTIDYIKQNYRVGNLYINRGTTGAMVARQPFGGGQMSGTNCKTGGSDYLMNFVEPRAITENTMRRGYAPKDE